MSEPTEEAVPVEETAQQQSIEDTPSTGKGVIRGDQGIEAAQVWISAFLVVIVGLFAGFPSLSIPFHGEDQALLLANDTLHRVVTVPDAFPAMPQAPLTLFGYALNWQLAPFSATALHLVNLLLHLANGVLLFLVCRRLFAGAIPEPVAMLSGMLLVAHPATAASVNCLVGRPVLQATFFSLLAMVLYLRSLDREQPRYVLAGMALLCYALAFASHAMALVLPLLLLGVGRVAGQPGKRPGVQHIQLAFGAAFLVLLVARAAAGIPGTLTFAKGFQEVLLLQTATLAQFANGLGSLSFDSETVQTALHLPALWALLLLTLVALAALWLRSPAGAALWWFAAALTALPCLVPKEHVLSQRFQYLALAGAALLLPWAVSVLRPAIVRKAAGAAFAAGILALCLLTYRQAVLWQNPYEFWGQAAAADPQSVEPWRYLGRYASLQAASARNSADREGLLEQAQTAWQNARRLSGDKPDPEVLAQLGRTLLERGKVKEARPILEEALHANPFDRDSRLWLAGALQAEAQAGGGRDSLLASLGHYAQAERMAPLSPQEQSRYAVALGSTGDFESAVQRLTPLTKNNEETPLAAVLKQFQMMAARVVALEQTAQKEMIEHPKDTKGLRLRAEANTLRGKFLQASYWLDIVLSRDMEDDEAWTLMGFVRAQMDGADGFVEEWGEQRAGNMEAWRSLATRCAGSGAWDAALTYVEASAKGIEDAPLPDVTLAGIAVGLKQQRQANLLLVEATKKYPRDPLPWLELADLAIAIKDKNKAARFLLEAEKRNAPAEEIQRRKEEAGIGELESLVPTTIIR